MATLEETLATLGSRTLLCVGDVMLDNFVYGDVSRISPEAATPVLAVRREESNLGGAGNVARNIASLGAQCLFVGVVGEDETGTAVTSAFLTEPRIEAHLVVDPGRPTTRKSRFVSEHHSTHLVRADWEQASPISKEVEDAILERVGALLGRADAVVLSDYAKGVLTPRVLRTTIDAARRAGKPVVVDPKGSDFSPYAGATILTPNRKELAEVTRLPARTPEEIARAAVELMRACSAKAVLVTRSEDGMTLQADGPPMHIPAYAVRVRDVSGAGDTVTAVLAAMLASGAGFEEATRAANAAAAIVVGKRGTATVSASELRSRLVPHAALATEEKVVFDQSLLDEHLEPWRRRGLRIGFTNGCFDLLHPGHVRLLTAARAACDCLIVGLNTDSSVRGLKGEGRPLQDERSRAEVLAALEAVDLVVLFSEPTPQRLIERVRPQLLVKGADYRIDQVVGRDFVEANGGRVMLVELSPGHSTSRLVEQSRQVAGV
jgi:D-beta-D-heptose 7-phosphate kinase / D-beta-D-heptose 1-phosphate adenosyltransferase